MANVCSQQHVESFLNRYLSNSAIITVKISATKEGKVGFLASKMYSST